MFNARAAKALAPGDHLTVPGAPGLRLIATEGKRTWTYRYRSPVDGKLKQTRLGHWPSMSPAQAITEWDKLRNARAGGADPAAERRAAAVAAPAGFTVRALVDEFLGAYSGTVADRTYAEVERMLAVELGPIEGVLAADLTRTQAFNLVHAARGRPVLAQRLRQALGAAWDHALDAGRLPADAPNWWRLILRGKLPSKGKSIAGKPIGVTKRVLSPDELRALLAWLPNFSRDTQDALTLYLWTCCRGAEIVAMERSEITEEPDGLWWTVPRSKLKMRRNPLTIDLRVPLVGRARAVVERRLAAVSGSWVFPSPAQSGHLQRHTIGTAVWMAMPYATTRPERERPRLPVTNWAPHDLRRTGRTMLASLGCPTEIAEAILGHIAPGVQSVYDRYSYDAERRVWLTKLSERLASLAV